MKKSFLLIFATIALFFINSCSKEDIARAIANVLFYNDSNKTVAYDSVAISEINVVSTVVTLNSFMLNNIDLQHAKFNDLQITLIQPNGTRIRLSSNDGGSNAITSICFDDSDEYESITTATVNNADHTCYKPIDRISSVLGTNPNGVWKLEIKDTVNNGKNGQLSMWGFMIGGERE